MLKFWGCLSASLEVNSFLWPFLPHTEQVWLQEELIPRVPHPPSPSMPRAMDPSPSGVKEEQTNPCVLLKCIFLLHSLSLEPQLSCQGSPQCWLPREGAVDAPCPAGNDPGPQHSNVLPSFGSSCREQSLSLVLSLGETKAAPGMVRNHQRNKKGFGDHSPLSLHT